METFDLDYVVMKPNGKVDYVGHICKYFVKELFRRMHYLKKFHGSLIKFY